MTARSTSDSRTRLLAALLIGGALSQGGCRGKAPSKAPAPKPAATAAPAASAAPAAAPGKDNGLTLQSVSDERYVQVIRPLLTKHGCDAGNCHGTFKGGGLFFATSNPNYVRDYETVLERIDRKQPMQSVLVQKALGKIQHNGGRNLSEDECDTKRLVAWIGGQPDQPCAEPPPARSAERFAREVVPALQALGCAAGACHGGAAPATVKLDLGGLSAKPAAPERAFKAFMGTALNTVAAWQSAVLRAAWGEGGAHHKLVDTRSCAYRRLHGYVAGAPESSCRIEVPEPKISMEDFMAVVVPALTKRGCFDSTCHGGGAGDMHLFGNGTDKRVATHDFLQLTARVEDARRPETSTLLRTARNEEPHGGGRRLGGKGDCVDSLVAHWLGGAPVKTCPPPKPPTFERFVKDVQPVLDKMTCTQSFCHGEGVETFTMLPRPDKVGLRRNYDAVLTQIDYDFMPLSGIQLRMREPCAYAVVGAWIEGKPKPVCVVHDPDPSIFPKRDRRGNVLHPQVKPGPPPPLKKT